MWRDDELLELAARALGEHAASLDAEQSVRGIDALDEVDLHPILARGFSGAGLGVLREVPYSGPRGARPRTAERERCDLVLLPHGATRLRDPVATLREADALRGTLFEGLSVPANAAEAPPEDACWIEVKTVGQFECVEGVPGPNRSYASGLVRGMTTDLRKLARDPRITMGALLLVLFTADKAVGEHDLHLALHKAIDANAPVRTVRRASFAITERIGNAWCDVCWIEAARAGADADED
jgi:hypothetical protein